MSWGIKMEVINASDIIGSAVSEALETMAFLTVEPVEGKPECPPITVTTEMQFVGPIKGTIRLLTGIEFARTFAENVSGLDEFTEEQCIDALKELLNITCGLVLPMIAKDPSDVYDLSVPNLTQTKERLLWDEFTSKDDVTVLDVEGTSIAVRLIIE
jgi:chemotaxis protein CheY-P-specific phosphatase CheC